MSQNSIYMSVFDIDPREFDRLRDPGAEIRKGIMYYTSTMRIYFGAKDQINRSGYLEISLFVDHEEYDEYLKLKGGEQVNA